MYEIKIIRSFSGAHRLKGYRGKCENVHGHNWRVEVELISGRLDKTGISVDFRIAKKVLDRVLKKLDHALLNDVAGFRDKNPSAENIARHIFDSIRNKFSKKAKVKRVTVWETENAGASYTED
ncbi:MAG TPA: 6-carboxytetrahydropterin synthase QueD [bacterium]